MKNIITIVALALVAIIIAIFVPLYPSENELLDATPQNITLSGTYTCLPHMDTTGPQTTECAFGIKADDGSYYAVNFGESADAIELFQSGEYVRAEGFLIIKEALSSDQWAKYNMKGIFTITRLLESTPTEGKLNINAVCEGALAYMTFPDGESAETFITECKDGKHPEVIEEYKKQMNLGDDVAI